MIYTKEPVNTYYVYLTAYKGYQTHPVNEIHTEALVQHIQAHPDAYGTILSEHVEGCYTEIERAGNTEPTKERTLQVHCTSWYQVMMLNDLAHFRYDQESVLVVNAQTHTASLVEMQTHGEYPQDYKAMVVTPIGVFTQQDTGAEHYSIIDGERWEVAPNANSQH